MPPRLKAFSLPKSLLIIAIAGISVRHAAAYGPVGHQIVGAIADERLANTPTGKTVAQFLDGMTLEDASVVPDTIKGWDREGVDDPKNASYFSSRPRIAEQLREFWRANQPTPDHNSPMPSHHWFHYTDIPVEAVKYSSGKTGRSQWDIVHMIPYCIAVLRGEIPEDNPRKITKPIAVILLSHYVGDIHQPLHVGAQYFDRAGRKVNPDLGKPALEDQGGNSISLEVSGGSGKRTKFHSFWDTRTVEALFPGIPDTLPKEERRAKTDVAKKELVRKLAVQEPKGWRMPANLEVKNYAEAWADEIMPIAREAHERLTFHDVVPKTLDDGTTIATGTAREKPAPDRLSYRAWSANIVRDELHKAGWRLAELLQKTVGANGGPSTPSISFTPSPSSPAVNSAIVSPPPVAKASPPSAWPYGAYPENYKEIITSWLQTQLRDPAAPRIEWQTEPKPADLPGPGGRKLYGYLVIFSTNGSDRSGASARNRTCAALIRDNQVIKANGFDR